MPARDEMCAGAGKEHPTQAPYLYLTLTATLQAAGIVLQLRAAAALMEITAILCVRPINSEAVAQAGSGKLFRPS